MRDFMIGLSSRMLDFRITLLSRPHELTSHLAKLNAAPALALDIETVDWWDRRLERVSLVQIAFRDGGRLRVAVIDALAGLSLEPLRPCLESSTAPKAMHNAAYDAVRLARHFRLRPAPIHDTMLSARRGGEKRYSLQAQARAHLGVRLDKSEQRGDWSRRPLALTQVRYAALDAVCTLLLYEDQSARGLSAGYRVREPARSTQTPLPLGDAAARPATGLGDRPAVANEVANVEADAKADAAATAERLNAPATALLGVVSELTGRYSPERLAVSADGERVGLAGWIIDGVLGRETDVDEETARLGIADLLERGLIRLNAARRLEATEPGVRLWAQLKPA